MNSDHFYGDFHIGKLLVYAVNGGGVRCHFPFPTRISQLRRLEQFVEVS